ncbi:MAG: hypothetical protein M1834_001309 [Cirrosporium novae-zelandiae]|nr:MAG: hypothetical protein M1834_001309 [Cirrosporium novae-zelandiae]
MATLPFIPLPKPSTHHLTGATYLIGYPLKRSWAPLCHGTIFHSLGLNWAQIILESTDLDAYLELCRNDPKFIGGAVTMPHKVSIIPRLDELTTEGRDVGACNTIFIRDGKNGERLLVGTNTDCIGIREAIRQNVSPEKLDLCEGNPGMVIGGGGTCRAAVYALKKYFGCSPVYLVNRDRTEVDIVIAGCKEAGFGHDLIHVSTVDQAESLSGPGIIVSAIPNYPPKSAEEKMARLVVETMLGKGEAEDKGALLEMCYNPTPNTEIAAISKANGWQVIPGLEAMIWQGLEQDQYWTGKMVADMPIELVKETLIKAVTAKAAAESKQPS